MSAKHRVLLVAALLGFAAVAAGSARRGEPCLEMQPRTWISSEGAPPYDRARIALWTGDELLTFTPAGGAAFDPCANRWTELSIEGMPPELPVNWPNVNPVTVVHEEFVVFLFWGAPRNHSLFDSEVAGAVYDRKRDSWRVLPLEGAPEPRTGAVVQATAQGVFVWGGLTRERLESGGTRKRVLDDGAVLDPETGTWAAVPGDGAPSARVRALSGVVEGQVVVWGGAANPNDYRGSCGRGCEPLGDGAVYDPKRKQWSPLPAGRFARAAGERRHGVDRRALRGAGRTGRDQRATGRRRLL